MVEWRIEGEGFSEAATRPLTVNGRPGLHMIRNDGVPTVTSFDFTPDGSRIKAIYIVSNPDKLSHVTAH